MLAEQARTGPGARASSAWCSAAARRPRRSSSGSGGRAGRGVRRVRDRPLDLVGRAQGVARRGARPRGRGAEIADNYLHFIDVYERQEVAR